VWLVVLGGLRVAVGPPEHCAVPSPAALRDGARAAVGWFEANQLPAGNFRYAYRRADDAYEQYDELVRPQGALLSLYQAAHDGYPRALAVAERALPGSEARLTDTGGGARAVAEAGVAPAGASALLVAALVERRQVTGDHSRDDLIRSLGTFLVGQVEDRGAVRASWDEAGGPRAQYSLFFTGEVLWALARVATVDPAGPWAEAAGRVAPYIATDRNRAEDRIPFFADPWAGYGLDELTAVDGPLPEDVVAFARHDAGFFDTSIRFESQNDGSWLMASTRGEPSLGAGVGTLGEGAAGLQRLSEQDDRLDDLREPLRHTVGCVAAVLVDRQNTAADVGPGEQPAAVVGAWFRHGRTQLDDQQHALSALLAADRIGAVGKADSAERPVHTDHGGVGGWTTVVLTLLAASNPLRRGRSPEQGGRRRSIRAVVLGCLALVVLARPLLDLLDVSEPTVRVAAGIAVLITGAIDLVQPSATDAALFRPGLALAVVAAAVDPGRLATTAAVLVAAGVARLMDRPSRADGWRHLARFVGVAAILLGADLIVDGIYEL
jgi:small neutral amino acid transporter SnatA (MarC family)